jgi:DNA-binding NarL/FixJ family response regulator
MTISVLIADDHAVVAEGLRHIVEAQPDIRVLACLQDGRGAVRAAASLKPDIVLIDHSMPLLNGTEATRLIRERSANTRVIILSMHSDQVHVLRALQAGASGYVVKRSAAKEVVNAIRAVHRGRRYLSEELVDLVLSHVADKAAAENPLDRLSSRERQVLQLLAEGRSVAEIAGVLSLSVKTVETYRARMMEKLDIHDLAALVKFAIQHGIVALE